MNFDMVQTTLKHPEPINGNVKHFSWACNSKNRSFKSQVKEKREFDLQLTKLNQPKFESTQTELAHFEGDPSQTHDSCYTSLYKDPIHQ